MSALFGPSGNSLSFYAAGFKHSYEEPAYLSSMGLDAYEYSAGNGITGSEKVFSKLGEEARRHGIALSFHTPYYISLSGIDPEKRLKSLDYIAKSLWASHLMGADTIVIHAGSASKISRAEAVSLAKDTLYRALCAHPDSPVRFGVETMGKVNQLGTLEEVLEICKMDKRLCPVVDFGHLNARDRGGVFKTEDDYKRVFDAVCTALDPERAERLHCHFSKIEYTDAGEKKHLTFKDEVFGPSFEPLMACIAKEGLSPRIICESDGTMAEDALQMKKEYLKNLK
jgi:deoxyribonuclease-4